MRLSSYQIKPIRSFRLIYWNVSALAGLLSTVTCWILEKTLKLAFILETQYNDKDNTFSVLLKFFFWSIRFFCVRLFPFLLPSYFSLKFLRHLTHQIHRSFIRIIYLNRCSCFCNHYFAQKNYRKAFICPTLKYHYAN